MCEHCYGAYANCPVCGSDDPEEDERLYEQHLQDMEDAYMDER